MVCGGNQMNTNRDLNYRLYLQQMSGFTHTSYNTEFERYTMVKAGDVERVKETLVNFRENFYDGKGILSDDPVRNLIYHFVVSVAMNSRVCIEGGMPLDTAYTLSDIYIRRADVCRTCDDVFELFAEMKMDFVTRMKELKKGSAISIHVRRCIDYIYDNLHGDLSVNLLAEREKLNPSYLSKLFSKETGMTIKGFITNVKVSTAENMLIHSDFSFLDISLALGFSSQSAFISVFKKYTGETPKQYRDKHCMEMMPAE